MAGRPLTEDVLRATWMSVADVAGLLDCTEQTVRRWIRDGLLPGFKPPKTRGFRINTQDIENFIRDKYDYYADEAPDADPEEESTPDEQP